MAVYTQLLAAGITEIDELTTDVYTAPTSGTIVIRDIVLSPTSNSLPLIGIEVRAPGGPTVVLAMYPDAVRLDTRHWDGRQVMEPGSTLVIYCTEGAIHYRITGYVLTP